MSPYLDVYCIVLCGVPISWVQDTPIRRGLQKLYFFFLWIVLSMFAGSRSLNVDRDLEKYYEWFHAFAINDTSAVDWLRDPSFGIISYLVSHVGLGFQVVVLAYAFLGVGTLIAVAVFAVSERWSTLVFYLLFCQYFAVADMTEIRAAVAVPLATLSILAICRTRTRLSAVLLVIALLFHFSAILALPIWVLLFTGVQFRARIAFALLVGAALVVSVELSPIIAALSNLYRLSEYLNGGEEQNDLKVVSWYALVHMIPIGVAVLYTWKQLTLQIRVATFLSALGMTCFFLLSWNTGLATRILYFFDLFWVMLWVYHLERIEGGRTYIYTLFAIALGMGLYFKSLQYLASYSILQM